ncbi:major facilitator superfamily transporter [Colletotrichum tofieldiae]|nr:major facilitator superfamily transporter [Colletotrichum tofieldiae]
MPFSRRPKGQTQEVSVANNTTSAGNINLATHNHYTGDEDSSNAEKKVAPSSPDSHAKQDAPMPNHARPGSGFGKLGDEDYELRDVDSSASRDNSGAGVPAT